MEIQSVRDLAEKVKSDPKLEAAIKENPAAAIAGVAATPLQTDKWIYRMVIIALGLTVLISIIGLLIMSFYSKLLPEGVVALGSAAVGALAGLLAPQPK
jgi:predicted permease